MIPSDIRNVITTIIALAGAIACFSYALTDQRRRAKKPVYTLAGIGFMFGVVFYSVGIFDIAADTIFRKWLVQGWLSAILFYLLTSAYIAVIITDWRRK